MVVSDCIAIFKYVEKENTMAGPSALNLREKKKKCKKWFRSATWHRITTRLNRFFLHNRVSGHQSQALEEQLFRTSGTNTSVTESHFHFRRGGQLSCQRRRDVILIMAASVSHPAEKTHPVDDWDVASRLNNKTSWRAERWNKRNASLNLLSEATWPNECPRCAQSLQKLFMSPLGNGACSRE